MARKQAEGGGCPVHRAEAGPAREGGAALAEHGARFEALLAAAVDAIIVIDAGGRIERFNPAAERMFGYAADEVVGCNVSMLMPEPDRGRHDRYLESYLRTGEAKIIGIGRQVTGQRKDGRHFPIDLSVGHVRLDDRDQFVGIARDLSERMRLAEEASDLRERLAHAARLGILGEMATGIAHEINQPLTAIANYAQACRYGIEGGTAEPAEVLEMLEKITRGARRAGEVIRRLRGLVTKRDSAREPIDLDHLVADVVRLAEVDARLRDARIELLLDARSARVLADGVQIQQVVLNLARNGVEAMLDLARADRLLVIATQRHGDEALVSVRDRGTGLPVEDAEQVFHPFFTTKRDGMGMGLSICRSIVESHGGHLDFSTQDSGTTFRFSLPLIAEADG